MIGSPLPPGWWSSPKFYCGLCFLLLCLAPTFVGGLPGNHSEREVYPVVLSETIPVSKLRTQDRAGEAELWYSGCWLQAEAVGSSKTGMVLQRHLTEAKGSGLFTTTSSCPLSKAAPFVQGPFLRKTAVSHQQATRLLTGGMNASDLMDTARRHITASTV